MSVQIFGKGVLGAALAEVLKDEELVWSDARIEAATPADILAPVVINCAGIVKQRPKEAWEFALSNAYGPHCLARACTQAGARLIHVSTDCIFGHWLGPSDEDTLPCPEDLYGATKLAGEVTYGAHLTVRTSFVGPGERGLWADIAVGVPQRASGWLQWSGHTATFVALVLANLAARPDIRGLLHIPGQTTTRWDLVSMLREHLASSVPIVRDDSYRRDRRLSSKRYSTLGLPEILSLAEELQELTQRG